MTTKVAIVTGAGTGIGRSVALALAEQGYCLGLAGRRAGPLEETAQLASELASELASAAGSESASRCISIPTDISDPDAVEKLFTQTQKHFGRLDLLFNNAGFGLPAVPLEELTPAQWKSVVEVNLNGTFFCTQWAFRLMKAQSPQGGRIINNGSISSEVPRPHSSPYTSTKHAIRGLTKSSSLDGRAYNIAVGQIDIGNAETETAAAMKAGAMQPHGAVVVEPMMDVDNVVKAVLYMAGLPLNANVQFMTVLATKMPFIARG